MSHHIIEFREVFFRYPDGTEALKGVSFRIVHGESVGIVGANGAGKSTLLQHLNGCLLPTSGQVTIGDLNLTAATRGEIRRKVSQMFTDPNRTSADVPGKVEGNPVFIYHDAFNPNKEEVEDLKSRYRAGTVGDVEVKQKLAKAINNFLDPIRERRAKYESINGLVDEVIYEGTLRMREEARQTLNAAKKAMGLSSVWNRISRKAEDARKKREKDT